MKQMALAHLRGKVLTTNTVLTQLMRLHQITCGHFVADDGSVKKYSRKIGAIGNGLQILHTDGARYDQDCFSVEDFRVDNQIVEVAFSHLLDSCEYASDRKSEKLFFGID